MWSDLVYQTYDNDCLVACLATVLSVSYEKALSYVDSSLISSDEEDKGIPINHIEDILRSKDVRFKSILTNDVSDIHDKKGIMIVRGHEHLNHFHSVIYNCGRIHDPDMRSEARPKEYVDNIEYFIEILEKQSYDIRKMV